MDRLVMQAGRALVRAMAGDDWHRVGAAVTSLWSLAYPAPQADSVQAELDGLREQVTAARHTGDAGSEQALEGYCATLTGPSLRTDAASDITSSSATLNGSVNPDGQGTTYRFNYGTTPGYGSYLPMPTGYAGAGTSVVNEPVSLTELQPGTTYHYRFEATNATGTAYGADQTFTTTPATSAPARPRRAGGHYA